MTVNISDLLTEEYAWARREEIGGERARLPRTDEPLSGGTVYLATADEQGNMVSYIQSNYTGFGSGLVVPGTGIALHNRGGIVSAWIQRTSTLLGLANARITPLSRILTQDSQPIGPFGGDGRPDATARPCPGSDEYHRFGLILKLLWMHRAGSGSKTTWWK